MSLRKNELAAVEITALAAGAGPPANRMATRRMWVSVFGGRESVMLLRRGDWVNVCCYSDCPPDGSGCGGRLARIRLFAWLYLGAGQVPKPLRSMKVVSMRPSANAEWLSISRCKGMVV